MMRCNRMLPYLLGAAAVGAVLVALGVQLGSFLPFLALLACPLMMVFMMRGMGGSHGSGEDHTGHGCEHDPTRKVEPPSSTRR